MIAYLYREDDEAALSLIKKLVVAKPGEFIKVTKEEMVARTRIEPVEVGLDQSKKSWVDGPINSEYEETMKKQGIEFRSGEV